MMEQMNLNDATETLRQYKEYIFPSVIPFYDDHPLIVARVKNGYLWDVKGNRYLDFFGGVLTVSVGHCNDEVTDRTVEQLKKVQHTSTLYINGIEHWGVEPDIMTFAKGMANGSPIGCTIATPEIADAVKGLTFATFGGNPVTMAAALATIEYIEKHNLPENAAIQGALLRNYLEDLKKQYDFIGEARGMGLMQAIEIVEPGTDKRPDATRTKEIINKAREHGLLIGKGGLYGNVVRIAPHLNVTGKEIHDGCDRFARALAEMG
jgi:4-aminobutyrate aminotransferase-like enzyme